MEKKVVWRAKETHRKRKSSNWYWGIGILAVGGAVASTIAGNALFALLIVLAGFAVIVAGSRPPTERRYALSEDGIHVDASIIPWNKIESYAIKEKVDRFLLLKTQTLWGTTTIPLDNTDHRTIEMELKNRNIEEEDDLESITEGITRSLGL